MEELKISLQEVTNAAATIRQLNNEMLELLKSVENTMNQLSSSWQSDGSNSLYEKFKFFSSKFEVSKEIIDAYGRFLDFTVTSYDGLESTLQYNATNLHD